MKKLITMLLAMGLLALLSLGTVAYADGGNNSEGNGNDGNGEKVILCQEKDDEFKLIKVKKDDLEQYLEDDAFFPKREVFEAEDEGKVAVKFWCDNNGNDNDDKKVIYLFQADKDDNGGNNGNHATIGIRQTALAL